MNNRILIINLCSILLAGSASAQDSAVDAKTAVTELFEQQATKWNQGDLLGFTDAFQKSPDILFVGKTNIKGYTGILGNFRHYFPNREAMGHLTYSAVEVQPLDAQFVTSTAHFHLQRSAQGGGDLDGYFMVVLVKMSDGWKIIRDASTNLPQSPGK